MTRAIAHRDALAAQNERGLMIKVLFDCPVDVLRQYRKLDDTIGLDGSKNTLNY